MGIIVSFNDHIVWEPSQTVGRLFVEQIRTLEHMLNTDSGVTNIVADEVEIDGDKFADFIDICIDTLSRSNNGPLVVMASGCLAVSLSLYAMASGIWPTLPENLNSLLSSAQSVMKHIVH
jgi:hypothetical protein